MTDLEPVVIQVGLPTPPDNRFTRLLNLIKPHFGLKTSKIVTAGAAVVIAITMTSFVGFSYLSNNKAFVQKHGLDINNQASKSSSSSKNDAALPGSGIATGIGGCSGTNCPVVTFTAQPATVDVGGKSQLQWKVTNNPTSCVASEDWTGDKPFNGSEQTQVLSTAQNYLFILTCKNATGTGYSKVTVTANTHKSTGGVGKPTVHISALSPIYASQNTTISWNVANNPTACTASGQWSGKKTANGSEVSKNFTTPGNYSFTLTCSNAAGSDSLAATVTVLQPPPDVPIVTISSNPVSPVAPGTTVSLSWTATNNPTSCVASGDWSGNKAASGSQNMGALSTIKTYSYTINCSNSAGGTTDTAAISVIPNPPVATLTVNPSSILVGNSSNLTWSATNNPSSCTAGGAWSGAKATSGNNVTTGVKSSAGSYTYTLTCSNSAGSSNVASATLIVGGSVTVTVSPSTINTGSSSTISWSATNSPTSCTAGGSWSGSKAASGSQTTGTISTPGSYIYSLSCTGPGGTASGQATLTVNNIAPVYCGGMSPCYGPNDLGLHSSVGNCWGWNIDWVINITSFRPSHKGGIKSGSTSTLENATAVCDHDIHNILAGSASIPGYKDSGGATTHSHNSSTVSNSGSSQLASYRVGYYDATKP